MTRLKFWVAITALVLAACGTVPVLNINHAPIVNNPNITLDDVGKAIQRGGAALGWIMQLDRPGHVLGTLKLRTHVAIVDINYDTKSYSIIYKDSSDLKYDGTNIHKNYNGWIENLNKSIQAQLVSM
jgi:hypothetical protein